MKIRTLAISVLASLVLAGSFSIDTAAQNKKTLIKENKALKAKVDSLQALISELLEQQHATDSIAGELIQIYEENENRSRRDSLEYSPEQTDSLLNLWYMHRQSSAIAGTMVPDSLHFTSNIPDSIYIKRLESINSYITLPYNETVRNFIILYSEKMPSKMATMLALAKYYFPIFEETLNAYEMPLELKYMAVIESALNPTAVSRARAKGMWQFIYQTGKSYGLKITSYVDERFDPIQAADAAARYMKDAYDIFGDWTLAISAYNCGFGNVNKAIRRAGGKRDFWSIYPYLPRETRGYMPAFVGAMYAFNFYKEHGIVPAQSPLPPHVDTFYIRKNLHFKQITDVVGIPSEDLHNLNPQYLKEIIPGKEVPSILRIPSKYTGSFIDYEDSLYRYKAEELFTPATLENIHSGANGEPERILYKVKKGDYLGKIAARHHVTVAQIKNWNGLRNNNLRVGQKLVIYTGDYKPAPSKSSANKGSNKGSNKNSAAADGGNSNYTVYVVKKGDTLSKIASRYPGVSAKNIMDFNGIGSSIKVGQKLKIPKK